MGMDASISPSSEFDRLPHAGQCAALEELAAGALARWPVGGGASVRLANLSENATYAVECADGRRFALRIHRDGYHSEKAIESELAWAVALLRYRNRI